MPWSIHTVYTLLFKIWRKRRHDLFLGRIKPAKDATLLDVGGYPWFWEGYPQPVARIDTINMHAVAWDESAYPQHNIRQLIGDGRAMEFEAGSYAIVFSNSVVEHVGTWDDQLRFAAEVRRVGHALWVQTPAYAFPIEPHYLAPCVHWMPVSWRPFVIRWMTPRGWLERPSPEEVAESVKMTRLLTKEEMRTLFPDCEIITERVLGVWPKSYVAVREK